LYDSRSTHEVLAMLLGEVEPSGHDLVQAYWAGQTAADNFETVWQTALHDGLIPETALPPKSVSLQPGFADQAPTATPGDELEIIFRPDPSIWDGRFANNGWLH
jgi:molybdopterin-containing oxidoreductase family iron-sulfur binding subunit